VEKFFSTGVQCDVGAVTVLLSGEHDLRRQRAMVEHPFELAEFGAEQAPESGGDVDVTAGEFETHRVRSARAFAVHLLGAGPL